MCSRLEETLGENDPVLLEWRERLGIFKKGIPLLMELSSENLKVSIRNGCFF